MPVAAKSALLIHIPHFEGWTGMSLERVEGGGQRSDHLLRSIINIVVLLCFEQLLRLLLGLVIPPQLLLSLDKYIAIALL